jgi:hypothetical protein
VNARKTEQKNAFPAGHEAGRLRSLHALQNREPKPFAYLAKLKDMSQQPLATNFFPVSSELKVELLL